MRLTGLAFRGGLVALVSLLMCAPRHADAQAACTVSGTDRTIAGTESLNLYVPGTTGESTTAAGASALPVNAAGARGPGAIAAGDLVLIVQMQGAAIDPRNQNTLNGEYGDGAGGDDRMGVLEGRTDFLAGQYEFNFATGPISGGSVPLEFPTANTYRTSNGVDGLPGPPQYGQARYQVVRVPGFRNLTIPAGAVLTGLPWDGQTGGIVAVDVSGTLRIDGQVNATGQGFRGGSPIIPCTAADPQCDSGQVGIRGEGIGGTPSRVYSRADGLVTGLGNSTPGGASGRGGAGNAGGGATGAGDSGGGGGGG
ncbi:MAG: hypothetical protein AB8I08_14595, partial [Sandaracinaceae bacterium]